MTARLTPDSLTPTFTLPNAEGIPVSLSNHPSRAVIVYFYPAVITPGCTTQAMDFASAHAAFAAVGYIIIGISPDTVEELARFTTGSKIGFPLLSDPGHEALGAYDAFGTKKSYGKGIEGVLHSTFVTDVDAEGNGTIRVAQHDARATRYVTRLHRELSI